LRACLIVGCVVGCVVGCIGGCIGEHRDARDRYNEGVAALATGEHEAAEKALLDARSRAGVDPELRFRAAYDLGVAFAAHADQVKTGKDADLAKALDLAQQAASWLGDADRLRPGHADTKANLGIVRARIQAISDELRKGEGKLEVRLDHLIDDQRGVLEEARGAWLAIKEAGGADPLAQQGTLTGLADRERGIVAEAGVVGDLAADEIDSIGKKPEDKRSDEEKVRVIQLKNLDLYLLEGRTRITEARRKLQELAAEDGVARSEAALVALKQAREQLLDPITVLRQIAQDELAVLQDTTRSDTGPLQLGSAAAQDASAALPGWLEPKVIAERQGSIRDRLEEVRARLSAAVDADANAASAPNPPGAPASTQIPPASSAAGAPTQLTPPAAGGPTQLTPPAAGGPTQLTPPAAAASAPVAPQDPKQQKLLERVRVALPSVGDASAAMDRGRQALAGKQIKQALEQEQAALEALAHAIEQFSDLKQTIELAYREHQGVVQLLSPEAAKQVDAATRGKRTRELLTHNLGRMPRIQELLADDLAQLEQQAAQLAAKAGEPPQDPKEAEAHKQQLEHQTQQLAQQKQMFAHAEELRGDAQRALGELTKALTGNKDPLPSAKRADEKLAELRKLFFDVVEHLKELIREQGDTRDETSAADGDDEFARQPKLPGLIGRQDGHGKMAKAITDNLAQQADAAGKQPQPPGGQQGPDAKALAGSADEVRQAQTDMSDAHATLIKARDATTQTERLEPGVKSQAKALEHLENALKLLQPPPQKNNQDQKQDQDQQQDQKKQEQQQQGGAGQRARDEDARRQRERRDREQASDPVEKDW
jgi:hypothetical protein